MPLGMRAAKAPGNDDTACRPDRTAECWGSKAMPVGRLERGHDV